MDQAVIVDAVRTPIGRAHPTRGSYRHTRSDDLAANCVRALLARNAVPPDAIEDVVLGTTIGVGEQGFNIARQVAILAGLPFSTGGVTVNRLCGSSLEALCQAMLSIRAGEQSAVVAGGLEHMQHLPMDFAKNYNPQWFRRTSRGAVNMGLTAEFLAKRFGISRLAQDEFALHSHQRAHSAWQARHFDREIVAQPGHLPSGMPCLVTTDQTLRPDTTLKALADLPAAFLATEGTVTAGNSSPLSDGAAAMLVTSAKFAKDHGLTPLARVQAMAHVGLEPALMGLGPVEAIRKLLAKTKLSLADVDLIEINEAFAAQILACQQQLSIPDDKLNIWGGALALGHPLGASGARIVATLCSALRERNKTWGIAAMCIGMGQGIAVLVEALPH